SDAAAPLGSGNDAAAPLGSGNDAAAPLGSGNDTAAPLWHGRFESGPAEELWAFTVSLDYDRRLAPFDLAASAVHARGLGRAGLLTEEETEALVAALTQVGEEMAAGTFEFAPTDEDVH